MGALAVAAAVALLAACSAIPAQDVNDPLGLDSQQLALAFNGVQSASSAIGAQAVTGQITETFEFDDWGLDIPLNPGSLSNDVSVQAASLSPATDAEAPDTITLSDPVLTVQVWQGAADFADATSDDRFVYELDAVASVELTKSGCSTAGAGSCSYEYVEDSAAFGTIKLNGTPLRNLITIGNGAPEPNHGSVSLTVQGEPDSLAGKTLTITLEAGAGTIGF